MLLGLSRAYDSPGDSVKIQILIQRPWGWSGGGAEHLHFSQPPPYSSAGKECARNAGDPGSIPGSGRSPGESTPVFLGFPSGSAGKASVCNAEDLGGKIPWRRERLPTPAFWLRESHELYNPKSQT